MLSLNMLQTFYKMINILALPNGTGSTYWRLADPLFTLQRKYPNEYNIKILDRPLEVEDCDVADIIISQSIVDMDSLALMYYYQQNKGTKIVVEADDYIKLNDDNPYQIDHTATNAEEKIQITMDFADAITTTTPYLAKKLKKFNRNVVVLPNYMLMDRWNLPNLTNESDEVRIGWVGSMTHFKDIDYIVKPLKDLLINRPKAKIIFMGDTRIKEMFKSFESRIECYLGVPFENYPTKLHGLRLDIGIAPLRPTEFNKCKSGIKALEYGICKVPTVASPVYPYLHTVKVDKTGFLAVKESAWLTYLEILIDDPKRRRKMGQNAYDLVTRKYNLEKKIDLWHTFYQRLMAGQSLNS